jgi:3-keto-disaccharide hydrolase
MVRRSTLVFAGALALATAGAPLIARQAAQQTASVAPDPNGPKAPIPEGFTEIFNGKDTAGWHVSRTNHHGTMPLFRVLDGVLIGTQDPPGKGGILLTDKTYRNVEVFLEVKPDWGCDGGLFLRSSEAGEAYQVMLDYLPGGNMGGVYGERLTGVTAAAAQTWQKAWKREEWNTVRARIEGDVPHIQVWINGEPVTDFTDTANHAKDGATDGMIAIQMHYSNDTTKRWVPGGFWRWRTIAIKALP